jgi:hypothetical protein
MARLHRVCVSGSKGTSEVGLAVELEVFSDDRGFFRFPNVPAGHYDLAYEVERPARTTRRKHAQSIPVVESMEVDLTRYQTGPFLPIEIPGVAPPPSENHARTGTIEIEVHTRWKAGTSGLPVHVSGWTDRGRVEQQVLTGPDGFVALDQLPAGVYTIKVEMPGDTPAKTRWTLLRPGEMKSVNFILRRPRRGGHSRWN